MPGSHIFVIGCPPDQQAAFQQELDKHARRVVAIFSDAEADVPETLVKAGEAVVWFVHEKEDFRAINQVKDWADCLPYIPVIACGAGLDPHSFEQANTTVLTEVHTAS